MTNNAPETMDEAIQLCIDVTELIINLRTTNDKRYSELLDVMLEGFQEAQRIEYKDVVYMGHYRVKEYIERKHADLALLLA